MASLQTKGAQVAHRALATPCGGPGACRLTSVGRCTGFPQTHWCGWLLVLGRVMFRRTQGSRPSPLPSPYGVSAMGQDCTFQLGRKKGEKFQNNQNLFLKTLTFLKVSCLSCAMSGYKIQFSVIFMIKYEIN